MIRISLLSHADIPEVLRIQRECYRAELIEGANSFLGKLLLYPEGCLGAWEGTTMCGYLFAHPWRIGEVVPLDCCSYAIPPDADGMYIHDLAVTPTHRGIGVGKRLLAALCTNAEKLGLRRFALVAVQESEPYWSRWGFAVQRVFEYAPSVHATYMICEGFPVCR